MTRRRGAPAERAPLRSPAAVLAAGARADEGSTAIEYCLAASLIAIAIYAGVSLIGINLAAVFTPLAKWL